MPIWEDKIQPDRRNFRRIRFTDPVQYRVKNGKDFQGSLGMDISETGMRILLNEFIPLQTELVLRIDLSKENMINNAAGRIVWITRQPFGENYQIGLEFINNETSLETKREIQQFIDSKI